MADVKQTTALPFGPVSFSFPDRAIVVKDKKTGKQTSSGIALVHIPFVGGLVTLQTVIWESMPVETPDGMVTEVTVSLPRGFSLTDPKNESAKDILDAWKLSVLNAHDAWREGAQKDGKTGPKARTAPRLVKAVKTAGPAPAQSAPATA